MQLKQEDFFIVLHNMLKSRPEVSEIHCVKDAKVPLIQFEFDGISIDLPYAQLKVSSIPEVSINATWLIWLNAYCSGLLKDFKHFKISIFNFFIPLKYFLACF